MRIKHCVIALLLISSNFCFGSKINRVNINTASKRGLEKLPGIGPETANLIIQYRSKYGDFKNIEELENIFGINDTKLEALRLTATVGILAETNKECLNGI